MKISDRGLNPSILPSCRVTHGNFVFRIFRTFGSLDNIHLPADGDITRPTIQRVTLATPAFC